MLVEVPGVVKAYGSPAKMRKLFGEFWMAVIKFGEGLLVASGALFVADPGNVGVFAFVFGVAHDAFDLAHLFFLREHSIMRRCRRATEGMTLGARLCHLVLAKCRHQPDHGLFVVSLMTGLAALGAGKSGMISG